MSAIFVTATGTDIGKTFVTAGLIRFFRERSERVEALKPVVSGFDPACPEGSDPDVLLEALGRPAGTSEIGKISPWRYRAALSPDLAAAREGRVPEFSAVVDFTRRAIAANTGILLIEASAALWRRSTNVTP